MIRPSVAVLLLCASLLAGCTNPSSADTADALTGSLAAAETAAKVYVQLPLCPQPTLCREAGVAAKIGAADTEADGLLKKYRAGTATVADVTASIARMVALIPVKK